MVQNLPLARHRPYNSSEYWVYRGDVMAFVECMGWRWPDDAANLLRSSLLDVQAFKASIGNHGGAGKTIT